MYAIDLTTETFEKWVGYCEKKNLASVGVDLDNPESFTKNAGSENYTIFAKHIKSTQELMFRDSHGVTPLSTLCSYICLEWLWQRNYLADFQLTHQPARNILKT